MAFPTPGSLTAEEYLERERAAEFRSEYWLGQTCAMSGATEAHEMIVSNLSRHTQNALAGTGCRVFSSNMKVGVTKKRGFAYPDLTITCGDRRFFDSVRDVLMNPVVIFEVLSDSTRGFDLGEKFREYQRLESLRHYVLVEQDVRAVTHFERSSDGEWLYKSLTAADHVLHLTAAASISLTLSQIYEDVAVRVIED